MKWIEAADRLVRNLNQDHPIAVADDTRDLSVKRMMEVGQVLIDQHIIRQIHDVELISKPVELFGCAALQGGRYPDGRFLLPRICGGSGFSREEARVRAYGEAAERYCAAFYDETGLRFGSHRQLQGDAVSPNSFALFTREQYDLSGFKYRPFLEDTRVNWVQGYSLIHQKPVFVPAAFVYLPYWPVGAETSIGLFPSTGLACGGSFLEAALRGIFEVIERDAIMIMWFNRMATRCVDPASAGSARLESIANSRENGAIQVFNITTDVPIPTRFALLTDSFRGRSLVSCGAAAHWDSTAAAEKAVIEALAVRKAVQKIIKSYPLRNYGKDHQEVREVDDHLNFYTNPDMLPALDFLTHMEASPGLERDVSMAGHGYSDQLRTCLGLLADRNLEAVVVDVTRPELADTGLSIVRVIIPGMTPLSFGARYACAGGRRVSEVPRALGYGLAADKFRPNPWPHPFA